MAGGLPLAGGGGQRSKMAPRLTRPISIRRKLVVWGSDLRVSPALGSDKCPEEPELTHQKLKRAVRVSRRW